MDEYIIVKKADQDPDRDWHDKEKASTLADRVNNQLTKWLYSEPINVKKIGVTTIAIKRDQNRFKDLNGYDFIKIIIKQIEVSRLP